MRRLTRADGDAITFGHLIGNRESLRLGKSRAERPIAQQNALRIQMRFAMASQLALDAAKAFQVFECHSIKTIVCAQRIDAILGMAGVVDEIISFMPGRGLNGKHVAVNGRHDFGEGSGTTPMTGRATVDCVDIHQRDQGTRRARIAQDDLLAFGIFDGDGIFGRPRRCASQFALKNQRLQRWSFDRFNNTSIGGHKSFQDQKLS